MEGCVVLVQHLLQLMRQTDLTCFDRLLIGETTLVLHVPSSS